MRGGYVGDSYVTHYVFDTAIGTIINTPTQNDIYGGADYGNASPVLSASVTINGHTVAVSGNDNGEIWAQGNGRFYTIAQTYQPHTLDIYLYGFVQSLIPSSIPTSVTVPFTYIVGSAGPNNYGQGEYALIDSLTGRRTEILANIETLTVSSTPLPAALSLFATGLGALGLLGWRRKRKAAALAA
jgi:hypothetical protein